MTKSLFALLVVTLAIAAFVGCSDDQVVNPRPEGGMTHGRLGASSATIGPSEIVFCLDVSDSISAGELESMVNGLGGCLSNVALIPPDSRVNDEHGI